MVPQLHFKTPSGLDRLGLRIRDDLAKHGMAGLWAHLVGVAFVMMMGWQEPERWAFRLPGAMVLTGLTVLRGLWILFGRNYTSSLSAWLRLYCPLLTATGMTWGLLWGVELAQLGWHPWQTGVEMAIIVAIAMGGVIAVAPVLRCLLLYQAALWLPVCLCSLLVGAHLYFMAALALICLCYVSLNGVRYHRDYRATLQREIDLEQARCLAEVASAAKGSFVANISHELRTPLHGILGMLDLSLAGQIAPEQRQMVETARNSADALLGLVNDILDFSKIEAGHMQAERIAFSPAAVAHGVVQLLAVQARQKGIALDVRCAPDLPPAILGDPTRLRQILINLVANAVKFTSEGGVAVALERCGDGRLRFAVHDTGIGIPPNKQALIFEAFAQADAATTRQFGGTGLGLALSQRLARLLGSEITVRSVPGKGSTFTLELVCEPASLPEPASVDPVPTAATLPLNILLVEDNVVNQRVALGMLERAGHHVTLAPNGQAALDRVAEQTFDLILMDLQMPVMGGDEATRRIREQEPASRRTAIVGLSANADRADRERCLALGMDDYLTKPFRREELIELIARTQARRAMLISL